MGPPAAFQAEDRGVRLSLPAPKKAYMFKKILDYLKNDDWRLVKTLSVDTSYEKSKGKIYFHLFESRKGYRKLDITTSLANLPHYIDIVDSAKKFEIYQEKIYRWEKGRHDPDIPRYTQVPEEDTMNTLKGSIK